MRIALLSPYSWTYPGGVTRHIEALAAELIDAGHTIRVLAPFDPDDATSRRLHRGARPQPRPVPGNLISLGRTVGIPANGAVSNVAVSERAITTLRRELRGGDYDVVHIHEPVAPIIGWDALCCTDRLPLVGTFHTYSENRLTNGIAAIALGGRRRMNRLHVRIAVSEAAAWTARRFYGGRYRIIPNGVHLTESRDPPPPSAAEGPLRILFIGQAVERKGLHVLLRAFEALRDQIPATLTLVGASREEVSHLMLDDRGVQTLGKVSEERKRAELERAQVLCAPSLHGESFGMVLTEALAAGTPVVASDIPGYREVVRHEADGLLVPAGDPLALAEALRGLALDEARRAEMARVAREHAARFAWPTVAAEVLDCYEHALRIGRPATRIGRAAARYGLAPSDLQPRIPAERLPSLRPADAARVGRRFQLARRAGLLASTSAAVVLAALALQRVGVTRVAASLVSSEPGLVLAGFAVMCMAMLARAIAWHAVLGAAPTWRRARRRDAMQGTFIGVLMSASLPARLGERSRALILARRLGRSRESLPIVLATMISQTLLNLLILAILGIAIVSSVGTMRGHDVVTLLTVALTPLLALAAVLLAPAFELGGSTRAQGLRRLAWRALLRLRDGLRCLRDPRAAAKATVMQAAAWGLQFFACWLLLVALGLGAQAGAAGAAAVLFAVNVVAIAPITPSNVGVFQAACVAVLVGGFSVSTPEAIAYGIVLQLTELVAALAMGLPALVNEGLSWREVRLRTVHAAAPVALAPVGSAPRSAGVSAEP